MTTSRLQRRLSVHTHRPWENVASIVLGMAILASGLLFSQGQHTAMIVSTTLTGFLVFSLGGLEIFTFRRWEERLEAVCGLWLAVAPWVLVYMGAVRQVHAVLGLCVCILGLFKFWRDRKIDPA